MLYLDTLREGVTPFDRFVSRADMKDIVDVPGPRKIIDNTIKKILKMINNDHTTRFLPIVGESGAGKTHLYWAIKEQDDFNCHVVYVPSPPAPVRMLFHIYSCLMNELGDLLKKIGGNLVKQYGGSRQSIDPFGVFKVKRSTFEIQRQARGDFVGLQSEFVKTLITYYMKGTYWELAERWLLGESLTEGELQKLGVSRVIEEDDICIAAIKLVAQFSDLPIVFYFDELEIPYNSYGPEAELRLLSVQKRMYNEVPNSLIIIACLKEIWPRVTQIIDSAMKSRMEMELELQPFTLQDTKQLFIRAMEHFWDENNIPTPPDPFFPLNEEVFGVIFQKTKGNPRDTIKMTKVFIDQILADDELREHLQEKIEYIEQVKQVDAIKTEHVATVPTTVDQTESFISNLDFLITAAVKKKEEEFEREMAEQIDISPATAVSALIDSALFFAIERNIELKISFDYEFTVEGKQKSISALLVDDKGLKFGIDIPTIKTFDKSGGVAAYYAIVRLKQALSSAAIDHACLIVPRETTGKKYSMIQEELGARITVIELNEIEVKELIRNAKIAPTSKGREFSRLLFKDLPLEPPTAEIQENHEDLF